jgi:hypothetical protein
MVLASSMVKSKELNIANEHTHQSLQAATGYLSLRGQPMN